MKNGGIDETSFFKDLALHSLANLTRKTDKKEYTEIWRNYS